MNAILEKAITKMIKHGLDNTGTFLSREEVREAIKNLPMDVLTVVALGNDEEDYDLRQSVFESSTILIGGYQEQH